MSPRPPDPPGGQDDPPDLRTALVATIRLLEDVGRRLEGYDLGVRAGAVRRTLVRLRDRLDDQ